MSKLNSSVPKFGDWDKNKDLSYSILFDDARAERERYLSVSQEDEKDRELFRKITKGHHGLQAQPIPEVESDGRMGAPNEHTYGIGDGPPNKKVPLGINDLVNDDAVDVSLKQPVLMATSLEAARYYAHHQHLYHAHHVPEQHQIRSYSNPAEGNPTTRKHNRKLSSGAVKTAEKTSVPKFGNWNVATAKSPPPEDISTLFDKARDEKKSASGQRSVLGNISPLRPEEQLFMKSQDSKVPKKKNVWLNPMCCLSRQ